MPCPNAGLNRQIESPSGISPHGQGNYFYKIEGGHFVHIRDIPHP
jgi:hypothetical protein